MEHDIASRVRDLVDYAPMTGVFTRKVRLAQRHQVGDRADFIVTGGGLAGYRRVAFDSRRYLAHRVAWLWVHGQWPKFDIDHINGDRGDNRIENLRDVSARINVENRRAAHCSNKLGLLGVCAHQGKWRSRLRAGGQVFDLGCFATPELAHAAYLMAKRKHHEGCTL